MGSIAASLGIGTGTLPQWGSLATLLGILGSIIGFYIKGIPDRRRAENEGRQIDIDANAASRKDDRADVERLTQRMDRLGEQLDETQESCRMLKLQVGQLHFALRLAVREIETGLPDSRVPSQIKELLAAVFPIPDPSGIIQPEMDALREIK